MLIRLLFEGTIMVKILKKLVIKLGIPIIWCTCHLYHVYFSNS